MNYQLWWRLFISGFLFLSGLLLIILSLWINALPEVTYDLLLGLELWGFPFSLIVFTIMLVVSLLSSFLFAIALNEPFEAVKARLNWLILGEYRHPIFDKKISHQHWYDVDEGIDWDIRQLRNRFEQLTMDLQEFSAAPTFVGEETKEEIIEEERRRIARELHDSVSQQLFASSMMLSALLEGKNDALSPEVQRILERIDTVIGNAQTEMRALLLHLRPIELEESSLKEGIIYLLREMDSKIPMTIVWDLDETHLESGMEDHLFRILQEALSNTLRHAEATRLEVYLRREPGSVALKLIDNGKGFMVGDISQMSSYGLRNMEERVSSMGGNFRVQSQPGEGTIIDILIPVEG